MNKIVGQIGWIVLIGGTSVLVGYTVALHQKVADTYNLADHLVYAEEVEKRLTVLSGVYEELLHRQSVNRENLAANTETIERNSQRMEALCVALLKRACVP